MRRSFYIGLLAVMSILSLMSCATETKNSKAEVVWLNNMHRLSSTHQFLMSWSEDNSKFSDPRNRNQIKNKLKEMHSAATELVADNKAPNADPIISFFSAELANEVRKSYSAFELNDLQMSQFALSRTSTYCIACHTRSDRGVKNFPINWTNEVSNLNPIRKTELLLANRHYQSGFELAKKLAADEVLAKKDPRSWILIIEQTLGMIIRVNNSPDQAEQLVVAVVNNKGAPFYIRRDAYEWGQDIQDWKSDLLVVKQKANFKTVLRLLSLAQSHGGQTQTSLIKYLRASGLLHVLLEDTKSANFGNVLLYSGIVADYLKDLNMGFLDQYYFESCIDHQPNSQLAERCYARLESSVRKANPFLDIDPKAHSQVISRLIDYRQLAESKEEPFAPKWKPTNWDEELEKTWKTKKDKTGP